jgi:hypothetical protein
VLATDAEPEQAQTSVQVQAPDERSLPPQGAAQGQAQEQSLSDAAQGQGGTQ